MAAAGLRRDVTIVTHLSRKKLNKTFLIIGQIWPEPETTGAGMRMMQLIAMLKDIGMDIHFASTAQGTEFSSPLELLDVSCSEIKLNHISFDVFIRDLDPGYVMFDRFATEEQFSWRVAENCPDAVRILDSEDLHFLRASRQIAIESRQNISKGQHAMDIKNRELASICRSDLTLVISEFEMDLLLSKYGIDPSLLFYVPFVFEAMDAQEMEGEEFEQREGFVFMGNWKHGPNRDAVIHLRSKIWPLIKKALPESHMHIYGAYGEKETTKLSDHDSGFHIEGWASDKRSTFLKHRVCLAPLRYGAGLKGKILDAMRFGTPNISSGIAAEGIAGNMEWGGFVSDGPEGFAASAVKLYRDKRLWEKARIHGFEILNQRFVRDPFLGEMRIRFIEESVNLASKRKRNWIGSMLWHHSMQSTKYLAKWIEAKNRS